MSDLPQEAAAANPSQVGPWRCVTGSLISGVLASLMYLLTSAIAQKFAATPLASTNPTAINISVAVRTLVVGITALGTGIFGLVALGLIGLAIQLWMQQLAQSRTPPNSPS